MLETELSLCHHCQSIMISISLRGKNDMEYAGGDKGQRIQKPKSAKAEGCTRKCVSTCIRGGAGAPGEGPLNVRGRLVHLCISSVQNMR